MKRIALHILAIFVCVLGLKAGIQDVCDFVHSGSLIESRVSDDSGNVSVSGDLSDVEIIVKDFRDSSLMLPNIPCVRSVFIPQLLLLSKMKNNFSRNKYVLKGCCLVRYRNDNRKSSSFCFASFGKVHADYYVFALKQILI